MGWGSCTPRDSGFRKRGLQNGVASDFFSVFSVFFRFLFFAVFFGSRFFCFLPFFFFLFFRFLPFIFITNRGDTVRETPFAKPRGVGVENSSPPRKFVPSFRNPLKTNFVPKMSRELCRDAFHLWGFSKTVCKTKGVMACNNTRLLEGDLRRFSNSKCFLEGFLEGACKGFQ